MVAYEINPSYLHSYLPGSFSQYCAIWLHTMHTVQFQQVSVHIVNMLILLCIHCLARIPIQQMVGNYSS